LLLQTSLCGKCCRTLALLYKPLLSLTTESTVDASCHWIDSHTWSQPFLEIISSAKIISGMLKVSECVLKLCPNLNAWVCVTDPLRTGLFKNIIFSQQKNMVCIALTHKVYVREVVNCCSCCTIKDCRFNSSLHQLSIQWSVIVQEIWNCCFKLSVLQPPYKINFVIFYTLILYKAFPDTCLIVLAYIYYHVPSSQQLSQLISRVLVTDCHTATHLGSAVEIVLSVAMDCMSQLNIVKHDTAWHCTKTGTHTILLQLLQKKKTGGL